VDAFSATNAEQTSPMWDMTITKMERIACCSIIRRFCDGKGNGTCWVAMSSLESLLDCLHHHSTIPEHSAPIVANAISVLRKTTTFIAGVVPSITAPGVDKSFLEEGVVPILARVDALSMADVSMFYNTGTEFDIGLISSSVLL